MSLVSVCPEQLGGSPYARALTVRTPSVTFSGEVC